MDPHHVEQTAIALQRAGLISTEVQAYFHHLVPYLSHYPSKLENCTKEIEPTDAPLSVEQAKNQD